LVIIGIYAKESPGIILGGESTLKGVTKGNPIIEVRLSMEKQLPGGKGAI